MSSKSHLLYFNNVNNRLSTYENVSCIRKKAAVTVSHRKTALSIVPPTLKGKRNK